MVMNDSGRFHLSFFTSLFVAASSAASPSVAFGRALRSGVEARVHVAAVKMV